MLNLRMRCIALAALAASQVVSTAAVADCPYGVLEITAAPEVNVDANGMHVLRWKGQSLMHGPISVWDVDVQVMLEKNAFTATYSVQNNSRLARQKTRVYFYFENPALEKPEEAGFVSAGLLGSTGDPGELGALASECRLYKHSNYPSSSFGDSTSRHSLKPGLTESAAINGELRIRGTAQGLTEVAQQLASSPPTLKVLISAKEARDRR